jgi:hypothetical protein
MRPAGIEFARLVAERRRLPLARELLSPRGRLAVVDPADGERIVTDHESGRSPKPIARAQRQRPSIPPSYRSESLGAANAACFTDAP